MKYIAYGSNMAQDQMAYRCKDAKLISTGYITRAKLEFYLHATVEKTDNPADTVPVAVWEISEEDEQRLDIYEGYPSYYTKETTTVHMANRTETEGMIYLMKLIRNLPPRASYYEGITNAYRTLGLAKEIETVLKPALERSKARG